MEKKKTVVKTPAPKKPAETSNEKLARLTNSIEAVSSELEALKSNSEKKTSEDKTLTKSVKSLSAELDILKLNIQKRKSENTTLKILFYTGLIVLLLGFLYTNSTLQRAQMDSIDTNINSLRTLMNHELLTFEKNVYQKIDLLEKGATEQSKTNLQESLEKMTQAISQLEPGDEKIEKLIDQVKKNSKELSEAFSEQGDSKSPEMGAIKF